MNCSMGDSSLVQKYFITMEDIRSVINQSVSIIRHILVASKV